MQLKTQTHRTLLSVERTKPPFFYLKFKHLLFFPDASVPKPSVNPKTHLYSVQLPRMSSRANLTRELRSQKRNKKKRTWTFLVRCSQSSTRLNYIKCFLWDKETSQCGRRFRERPKKNHQHKSKRSEDLSCGFTLDSLSDLNKPVNPLRHHSTWGT